MTPIDINSNGFFGPNGANELKKQLNDLNSFALKGELLLAYATVYYYIHTYINLIVIK